MTRRSTPWRKPPPPVLSTPDSVHTIDCYAAQGKGATFNPISSTHCELVLINADRQVMIVPGYAPANWQLQTDAVALGSGWLVLGWRPLNDALPFGELDRVDPLLADLAKLCEPNVRPDMQASIKCHPDGSPLLRRPRLDCRPQ